MKVHGSHVADDDFMFISFRYFLLGATLSPCHNHFFQFITDATRSVPV